MKITFLGTGACIADKNRGFSGLLIEIKKEKLLFDCGPGIVKTLEISGSRVSGINNIFLTHLHPDHVLDYQILIVDRGFTTRKRLIVHGPKGLKKHTDIICNKLFPSINSVLNYSEYLVVKEFHSGTVKETKDYEITCAPTNHYGGIAYRVDAKKKHILYSGDTLPCKSLIELGKDVEIAILECSFLDKKKSLELKHLYPESVALLANEMKAKKIILTHMDPECYGKEPIILEKIKKHFDKEIVIAKDGMVVKV